MDRALINLGRKVAELRELRGLTQAELATAIGDRESKVSRIERGLDNLTARSLVCVALALGVPLAELFTPPIDGRPRRPGRPRKQR